MRSFVTAFAAIHIIPFVLGTDWNPINDFCLRYYHQSVVKNGILYIDGGDEIFVKVVNGTQEGGQITGYNNYLLTFDMTQSWDWKTNLTGKIILKSAINTTGSSAPTLIQGALYQGAPGDPNIYQYGGTTSYANTSFEGWEQPAARTYGLWSYNTQAQTWSQYNVSAGSPYRPSNGAWAEAPDLGLAFYLNGEVNNGSSEDTKELGEARVFLGGMMVLDLDSRTATNHSTFSVRGSSARVGGGLQYVAQAGENGVLVAIGGSSKSITDYSSNETLQLLPLDVIDIFDVESVYYTAQLNSGGVSHRDSGTAWYKQNATGDIPSPRQHFCVVGAAASDNSSYNIYLYGGRDNTEFFDDVFVLSLPSFTWTRVYGPGQSARYGHTCHLVGNRQMLTIGGALDPSESRGACDWELKGVAILDMSTLLWGSVYVANDWSYRVPSQVRSVIGGSSKGGATLLSPAGGFSDPNLRQLFSKMSIVVLTANSTGEPHLQNHGAAIAGGGAAGGLVLLVLVVLAIWFRHHKRKQRTRRWASNVPELSEEACLHEIQDGDIPTELPTYPTEIPGEKGGPFQYVELDSNTPGLSSTAEVYEDTPLRFQASTTGR